MTTSGSFVRRLIKTARATLRERDNLPSYPTLQRTVSDGRLGDFQVNYDDMRTINFSTSSVVRYPVMLRVDDPVYLNSTQAKEALGSIAVTGVGGGLTATGSITKGVSDALLADIPGSPYSQVDLSNLNYAPFTEDGVSYAPRNDNEWWATGSIVLDVGEGFSSPVWSKTKIEIDISPAIQTQIGYEDYSFSNVYGDPSLDISASYNSTKKDLRAFPTAYFNFADKKWEPIGTGAFGSFSWASSKSVAQQLLEHFENVPQGFSTSRGMSLTGSYSFCRPISNYGFPCHPKFHATSSQTLNLSDYIKHPFVLEKFVLQINCEYTSSLMLPNELSVVNGRHLERTLYETENVRDVLVPVGIRPQHYATINTCFLLNQRESAFNNIVWASRRADENNDSDFSRRLSISASVPTSRILSVGGTEQVEITTSRDLIAYAQITSYSGSHTKIQPHYLTIDEVLTNGVGRELNIDVSSEDQTTQDGYYLSEGPWSGPTSFAARDLIISGTCRKIPKVLQGNAEGFPRYADSAYSDYVNWWGTNNEFGGRSGIEMTMTGRELNSPVAAQFLGDVRVIDNAKGTEFTSVPEGAYDVQSPYVLFPNDKLILGWQVPTPLSHDELSGSGYPLSLLKFFNKPAKLTLYGSLLREGREYHEPLNQPLNTAALHEALHFDNPVIDQFEVATKYEYSGSYTDAKMSSTLSATADGTVAFSKSNASQKTGSYIINDSASTELIPEYVYAGTQHVVEHTSNEERFYDSLIPDLSELLKKAGDELRLSGIAPDAGYVSTTAIKNIHLLFPFESEITRKSTFNKLFVVTLDSLGQSMSPTVVSSLLIEYFWITSILSELWVDANGEEYKSPSFSVKGVRSSDAIKVLMGMGDRFNDRNVNVSFPYLNNLISPRYVGASSYFPFNLLSPQIRGWKYGLYSGFPTYTRCIFRRGRYGQPRDMLEQRYDSKFFFEKEGAVQAPIQVKFVNSLTNKATSPEQTWSSNLSFECTSSLPYFDGVVRNRLPIVLSSLNQNVINVSSDGNGNLTL